MDEGKNESKEMAKLVNNIQYSKERLETLYTNDELAIKERFIPRVI